MRWLLFLLCLSVATPVWAGASRSFDGTDDYIDMGNVLDVTTNDVSQCIWIKVTPDDANFDEIIGRRGGGGTSAGYRLRQRNTDDFPASQAMDGVDTANAAGTTDLDLSWFFVCGTWNQTTNDSIVYVNAISEGTINNSAVDSLTNAVNFQIGTNSDGTNDLKGLAAYGHNYLSKVLSVVEVTELMWNPGSITDSLSGFWPLWGASTEQDLSGNGRTGTVTGATTSTDGPPVMIGGYLPV